MIMWEVVNQLTFAIGLDVLVAVNLSQSDTRCTIICVHIQVNVLSNVISKDVENVSQDQIH